MTKKSYSYNDLLKHKQKLRFEIENQEEEIRSNKYLKISSALFNGNSMKQPLFESISAMDLKGILSSPIANILSTYLMSNKLARKYFISFTIIKEMVPFAVEKIKEIIDQNNLNQQKKDY